MALCFLAWVSAFGDDKTKTTNIEGIIIASSGDTLIVSTPEGGKTVVVLTNGTKVKQVGFLSQEAMPATVLIPGLQVSAEGENDNQSRFVAQEIDFDGGDLQTAQKIQAGLHPTAERVAANQQSLSATKEQTEQNKGQTEQNKEETTKNQEEIEKNSQATSNRFSELSEYDEKANVNVNFAPGSSDISAQDKETLTKLAQDAASLTGYIIEVKGYADSSGGAVMNTKLSEDRAQTVVAYLLQDCNVPMRHIVSTAAMGATHAVASNETASGRAQNRRVEVKVLRNKGIAGQ
jgi:outer membrane protein OmpA-like peptidoglycan-associated protein